MKVTENKTTAAAEPDQISLLCPSAICDSAVPAGASTAAGSIPAAACITDQLFWFCSPFFSPLKPTTEPFPNLGCRGAQGSASGRRRYMKKEIKFKS